MMYPVIQIQNLRKETNPSEELLTLWGHHNHTILELFILLSKMQHIRAMTILQKFVDGKYHSLIYNGRGNLTKLRKNMMDWKIGVQNFNQNQKTQENIVKVINNVIKEEKILNHPTQQDDIDQSETNLTHSNNILASMPAIFSTQLPRIPYNELAAATNDWKKENVLGKGGFGIVYRG